MESIKTPEMVFVKGGTFTIGCLKERDIAPVNKWEEPACQVTLSDFWIGKYPVTNEEYAFFLNHYGSDRVKEGIYQGKRMIYRNRRGIRKSRKGWYVKAGYERHPVTRVTWFGAHEYCNWLHFQPPKNPGVWEGNYHLPLEAQWEYAARGGNESKGFLFSGSNKIDEVGWFDKNSGGYINHKVGLKIPNELGIYDMSGNVMEWCKDWFDGEFYKNIHSQDPIAQPLMLYGRSLRGGGSPYRFYHCRIATRFGVPPKDRSLAYGFRIAKSFISYSVLEWYEKPIVVEGFTSCLNCNHELDTTEFSIHHARTVDLKYFESSYAWCYNCNMVTIYGKTSQTRPAPLEIIHPKSVIDLDTMSEQYFKFPDGQDNYFEMVWNISQAFIERAKNEYSKNEELYAWKIANEKLSIRHLITYLAVRYSNQRISKEQTVEWAIILNAQIIGKGLIRDKRFLDSFLDEIGIKI